VKRIQIEQDWPESWKASYPYDLEEIYGEPSNLGYANAYKNRKNIALKLIEEVLSPGAHILDIAGAQGNFSLALAEKGYKVTWNDLRADLVEYVRMKQESGIINFAPGNAFDLKFPELFDAVLITEVIEHVAHPDQFLEKVASLVKPGGYIVMTTPNGAYFRNSLPKFSDCPDSSIFESVQFKPNSDGHIFLLHSEEIYSFADASGLSVEKLSLFTNPLTSGHMKLGFALKLFPKGFVEMVEQATQRLPSAIAKHLLIHIAARFRKPPAAEHGIEPCLESARPI
jgi:2-polyprenyl-6-hydroxyphenyl methylase/3-demethylubiquinone-9 3-methyltransferase